MNVMYKGTHSDARRFLCYSTINLRDIRSC
jgi:hypothetical protein